MDGKTISLWAAGDYMHVCFATMPKKTQKQTNPTVYDTEIVIKWISLKIDEDSSEFHNLFICAKFECSTINATKVIKV